VFEPDKTVGGIQDFKSIRFMRMVFADFQQPIVCRFASLDLVRGEWRRYNFDLSSPGEYLPIDDDDNTLFDVTAVNVEENGKRSPINYVIPPGIEQEVDNTTTTLRRQNEQSLVLKVCDLKDGDSRAAYKTSDLDVRSYKRIKMFVHAEGKNDDLSDGDFSCFIRLGTDFVSNE
jgi:cell surface protein SprA